MSTFLDVWRYTLTVTGLFMIGLNLTVTGLAFRLRHSDIKPPISTLVWCFYTTTAACTGLVAAYFRLHDTRTGLPFGVGDVTALVPIGGFTIAGILALRLLGRRSAPPLNSITTSLPHTRRRDDPS